MALGNANTSAQARGKNKPILVQRRKEVVAGESLTAITATSITGETLGAQACFVGGSMAFDKEYYVNNMTGDTPDVGAKVYTRPRVNDDYLLPEGLYLFKVSGVNWVLTINSSNVVSVRSVCR